MNAVYIRVSSVGQRTESQERELRRYCRQRGWKNMELYHDRLSGAKTDRPALDRLMRDVRAGKVHRLIVYKLDRLGRSLTHNVDGHFQKAGFSAERIAECHGSIHHFQCCASCTDEIWDADGDVVSIDDEKFRALEPLPRCRNCSALARPNILMFGDWSWLGDRTDQQQELFSAWLDELSRQSATVAVIELGAGGAIPTVRHTSERVVQRLNGKLIRINPRDDSVPTGHIGLPLGAAEGIRQIYDCAASLAGRSNSRAEKR